MPNNFYVTFMVNVSDPLYNDSNRTSDFWTKLSPTIKFDDNGKYEVALVDCILKNTYDILRKDRKYEIKVIPFDWSVFVENEWVEALKSSEYPNVTLKYKEYGNMMELCAKINRKISYRRNGSFHFNY